MEEKLKNKMLDVFKGGRTLFLENDYDLYHTDKGLGDFLLDNKCDFNVLARVDMVSIEYVIEMVEWHEVLAFQTQWVYENSFIIREALMKHKFSRPKKVVECCLGEPTWYNPPKNLGNDHEFYTFSNGASDYDESTEDWEFYMLRKDKMPWDK